MTRKLKPATPRQRQRLKEALLFLQEARKCLVDADCPATLRKVRRAIKSADGAMRHMQRRVEAPRETFVWTRGTAFRGRHYTSTKAGLYAVVYKPGGGPGHSFIGTLNERELSGVSGPNVAIVKRMIEDRIIAARKIARAK